MCAIAGETVEVAYHESGRSTIAGTQRCKSMAACPVCAETGRRTRAAEIDQLVANLLLLGCHVFFVTATVAHPRPYPLRILQRAVNEAWQRAWSGKAMQQNGFCGQVKAWDYTYGANGWHPHIHALVVVGGWVDKSIARSFVHQRFAHYQRGLRARNQDCRKTVRNKQTGAVESVGWDVQDVTDSGHVAAYTSGSVKLDSKWTVGHEIASAQSKRRSVSPWAILRAAVDGEVPPGTVLQGMSRDDLWTLWREYEQATKSLRQIVIGRNLAKLGNVDLATDDEAVAGADDTPKVYVESFTASQWQHIVEHGQIFVVLEAVERIGAELLRAGP